eukprot:3136984-Amphidinium_carterae.1
MTKLVLKRGLLANYDAIDGMTCVSQCVIANTLSLKKQSQPKRTLKKQSQPKQKTQIDPRTASRVLTVPT